MKRTFLRFVTFAASILVSFTTGHAQLATQVYGPYNAVFIAGGTGLAKKALPQNAVLNADSAWSMYCWVQSDEPLPTNTLIAGIGTSVAPSGRFLAMDNGKLALWAGGENKLSWGATIDTGNWHLLAVTYDGRNAALYADGEALAEQAVAMPAATPVMWMAPEDLPWPTGKHFAGKIAGFTITSEVLTSDQVRALHNQPPNSDVIEFEKGSKNWPVQTRAQAGMLAPQDPATLPRSSGAPSRPIAKPATNTRPLLTPRGSNKWIIAGAWRLSPAPQVTADGSQISQAGFRTDGWLDATVPGTVLTTFIDRGIYPDPDYGLNNLAIPETLNKQDYWYRTVFNPPASVQNRRLALTFNGINYAATVWLNGNRLGEVKGAFIRGVFDVTGIATVGQTNVLAVRISPPPHPGIPQEQSVKAGPGDNGGIMCLDGPTFVATEGWDWIPGIRDRNTGIWQDVTLSATGPVNIGDTHVVTTLPLRDTSRADVSLAVALRNESGAPVTGTLNASFEGVNITKRVSLTPGESVVRLAPSEFPRLTVANPRLWWPNGYGNPELYHLKISFSDPRGESDNKTLSFGIREITYELSLLGRGGHLRRVEFSPTAANGEAVVDGTHEGILHSAEGWVASLRASAERSPAIHELEDTRASPYLVIRVNGVRIACKGGNWGMDDSRKRVSREHLEPFFRLHRDANLNIIRNWVGQNTEEIFYDLADEYGLLVWNDFWDSTQNYNLEPDDSALFLTNARDTILRFRNHPSIVIWCGRNEGVPAPAINEGLDALVRSLDGTRYYTGSSNVVNLQNSGPYRYEQPAEYFTKFAHGFAVELGVPSMPTLDAFRAMVPAEDQWPPNDTWAYHDWHQAGNGVVAPFMAALTEEFGAASNLEDFERKAQMLNYEDHRAIFEGFNAHLWNPNSGRMLWMTQPAWPSTMWQILSSDYDTQASYYGAKKASEPIHVQMNLPDLQTAVINNTTHLVENLALTARVFSLDGKLLSNQQEKVNAQPGEQTGSFKIDLPPPTTADVVFVKLDLRDAAGTSLSDNFYWYSAVAASYRKLNGLNKSDVTITATQTRSGDWVRVGVDLANRGTAVALMTKVTLRNAPDGTRILPAYLSDNYVSLLPGETRNLRIECPAEAVHGNLQIEVSGWNVTRATVQPSSGGVQPDGHAEKFR